MPLAFIYSKSGWTYSDLLPVTSVPSSVSQKQKEKNCISMNIIQLSQFPSSSSWVELGKTMPPLVPLSTKQVKYMHILHMYQAIVV